jgi:hypothetical protein
MRWAKWIVLALGLAGCGPRAQPNGICRGDGDCRLCEVCGCTKAYSELENSGMTCAQIQQETLCTKGMTADCMSGPLSGLCVANRCQAVQR